MYEKLLNSLLTNDDFLVENEFYKKYTNFNTGLEFHNAIGIYTVGDKVKMGRIPNLNELIAKNSKFNNFDEFCTALEDFLKEGLPDIIKDAL